MIDLEAKLKSIEAATARKHSWYEANKEKLKERRRTKNPPKLRTRRTHEEHKAAQREWYSKNAEVLRERARKNRLILSREKKSEYSRNGKAAYRIKRDAQMAIVAGRPRAESCELCGGVGAGRSKHAKTVFDHDHSTGEFRGWLCNRCNVVAGLAEDDPQILRVIANYLDLHNLKRKEETHGTVSH